jgi:threonine efflux protein
MIETSTLITVALVMLFALVTPGPDFVIVSRIAITHSRYAGLMTALGISCAILVWAGASLLGLSVLLERFAWIYGGLKVVGGVYLIYLGFQTWRGSFKPSVTAEVSLTRQNTISSWVAWRQGFLTNMANPKAVVFFGSVFTALLPPNLSDGSRLLVVGLIVIETIVWFSIVAIGFSTKPAQRVYQRVKHWIDRATGSIMIFFGARLLISKT